MSTAIPAVVTAEKFSEPDDEVSSDVLSDADPKDSGVECGGSDPQQKSASDEPPDEETAEQIMRMVEFYLSDANILKDPFLLKHVRRNKEGFVSLKLLASFRKVRSLSRSWKAVASSVRRSRLLALNADGSKVRRLAPLPDHDETVTSRSLIVSGCPVTVDGVSDMFSACGEIALVRILRPGGSIPSDVKRFLARHPALAAQVCALVEFEEHAAVLRALELDTPGVSVTPVALKAPESPKKEQPQQQQDSPKKKKKNRKASLDDKRTRRSSSGSVSSQSSGYLSSSPSSSSGGIFDSRYPRRHSFNPSIYNDPNSSFASLGRSRERLNSASSATLSPWRRRREQQQLVQSDSNLSVRHHSLTTTALPVKTVRMPRGPDGTNGFGTRARLPSTAE